MKRNLLIIGILIAGILFISSFSSIVAAKSEGRTNTEATKKNKGIVLQLAAQEGKEPSKDLEASEQKPPPPVSPPIYKPPLRGAPGGRVGGGTRGIRDELFTLFLLAPDHVGLTVQKQPILYWYISKLTRYPIEVTIIEDQAIYPLFEKRISLPVQPGLQYIRLADYNVHLSPNIEYWWFVSVVPDPDHRSKDILAGGLIERVAISDSLQAKLAQAQKGEIPQIYAEAGIWYDALMTLSDLIDATPNDPVFRKQRAALLEQIGLSSVAQYDLKQALMGR